MSSFKSSVQDFDHHTLLLVCGCCLDHAAQCVGDTAAATDDSAEVTLVDLELEDDVSVVLLELADDDGLRLLDQRAGEKFEQLLQEPAASMPLVRNSVATWRVGRAPFSRQCLARSSSISISEGSVCGLYWPIVSIERPSRGERRSETTMRQIGFLFEPTLLSLIRTISGVEG